VNRIVAWVLALALPAGLLAEQSAMPAPTGGERAAPSVMPPPAPASTSAARTAPGATPSDAPATPSAQNATPPQQSTLRHTPAPEPAAPPRLAPEIQVRRGPAYLAELERKARAYEVLRASMSGPLGSSCGATGDVTAVLRAENVELRARLAEMKGETNRLHTTVAQLKAELCDRESMIGVLRLSTFEYYEVRTNDTCESIVMNPMIYGDATLQTLIRQVNRGLVSDMDNLKPGEILIIPRLKRSSCDDL